MGDIYSILIAAACFAALAGVAVGDGQGAVMGVADWASLITAVAVFVYLCYALLFAERF